MIDLILIILIFGLLLVDLVIIGRGVKEIRRLNDCIKVLEDTLGITQVCMANIAREAKKQNQTREYLQ